MGVSMLLDLSRSRDLARVAKKSNSQALTRPGHISGIRICRIAPNQLAPEILALSSRSGEIPPSVAATLRKEVGMKFTI